MINMIAKHCWNCSVNFCPKCLFGDANKQCYTSVQSKVVILFIMVHDWCIWWLLVMESHILPSMYYISPNFASFFLNICSFDFCSEITIPWGCSPNTCGDFDFDRELHHMFPLMENDKYGKFQKKRFKVRLVKKIVDKQSL